MIRLPALWQTLRQWARALKSQVMTLWFCRQHPQTPLLAKLMAVLVVAYALSPIDLIPDFIPVLGYLDDVLLLPLGIYVTLALLPENVIVESRARAEAWIAGSQVRPRSYVMAFAIVCLWIAAAWWLWRWFVER